MQLFVGSEGTLGVITQIILKLLPLPRARATALAIFAGLDQASAAVTRLLTSGMLPVAIELMDGTTVNLVEDHMGMGLPRDAEALLIFEQDGSDAAAARADAERMASICRASGAIHVDVASDEPDRERLWAARRAVSPALGQRAPNKLGEDIVVPRAAIPAMIQHVRRIADEHQLLIPIFGHAGDGNLHPNLLFDRRRPGEMQRVQSAAAAIFRAAIDLGGTLSGEHGVGNLKREFMTDALGADVVAVMRDLKHTLDPRGILNPGKKLPTGSDVGTFLSTLPVLDGVVPG
jgi:glycolate oxidase